MSTDTASRKQLSIVLKLVEVTELNGGLGSMPDSPEKEARIRKFFMDNYGHGEGALKVESKASKVKLTWVQETKNEEAEEMHKQALSYARVKNYKDATALWIKAIIHNPKDPDYYFNLGIAFFETKNYKEAVENLHRALTICPVYYKAQLILGTVYLKIRQFEKAEKYLTASLVFFPKHPLAYLNLGAVFSILKRYNDGISMFLKTIDLSPREVRAHFGLAKIYSLTGAIEKARQYYNNVIEIDANEQLVHLAKRAMVTGMASPGENVGAASQRPGITDNRKSIEEYYQEGYAAFLYCDYEHAVKMYQTYLASKPDDDFVWYSLGEACLRANKLETGAQAFKKATELNANKAVYQKELAIAYNYLGKQEETIHCLKRAQQLGKNDSISNTIWGKILLEKKDFEAAQEKLEAAIKQDGNNLLAKYNLAIAFVKTSQMDLAANQLHEILRAPLNSPIKMEAESLLKRTDR